MAVKIGMLVIGILLFSFTMMGFGNFYNNIGELNGVNFDDSEFDSITGGQDPAGNAFLGEVAEFEDKYIGSEISPTNFVASGFFGSLNFIFTSIQITKDQWFGAEGLLASLGFPSIVITFVGVIFSIYVIFLIVSAITKWVLV